MSSKGTQRQTATTTATIVTQTSTSTTASSTTSQTPPPSSSSSTPTTTRDASAPVRPTSGDTTTTTSSDYCPTGFYACSAVYGGGCCQTGRDCQTTSCPTTASTTIVDANGATVVVPATAVPTTTTNTATCASGWSICPSSGTDPTVLAAGCCPTGYSCGTASCFLATGSATASVAKEIPGSAANSLRRVVGGWSLWAVVIPPCLVSVALGLALV